MSKGRYWRMNGAASGQWRPDRVLRVQRCMALFGRFLRRQAGRMLHQVLGGSCVSFGSSARRLAKFVGSGARAGLGFPGFGGVSYLPFGSLFAIMTAQL